MSKLNNFPIPLLGLAAYSGTGKTTLLEQLIPRLIAQGVQIAVVKHSHHDIEFDKPGKDSYRLRKAGACQLLLAGTQRAVLFDEYGQQQDKQLIEQLQLLNTQNLDLVLVEGYRDEPFDKIELNRSVLKKPFMFSSDSSIIAVASDQVVADCTLPQLDLNSIEQLTQFVLSHLNTLKG